MYRLEREVEVKQEDEDFVEIKEEIEEINELEGFIEGNPKNVNEINTGLEQHGLSKDNTGPECKDRWESLQSQYCKHVNEAKPSSGRAAASSSKWKYENQMAFLYTFMKDRSQISTVMQEAYELEDENAHDDEETLSGQENWNSEGEPPEKKYPLPKQVHPKCKRALEHISHSASATLMKYLSEKKKEECAPDTIDTFFSLMAATVKKFNPSDQHFIKIKVFSLVKEIEGKYIQYQNSHSYSAFPQSICPSSAMPSPSQYSDTSTGLYTQPLQETPYH